MAEIPRNNSAEMIPIESSIDLATFEKKYVVKNKPVIIKGLISNAPAVKKWSRDYLESAFGSELVTLSYIDEKSRGERKQSVFQRENTAFAEALDHIFRSPIDEKSYYLMPREIPNNPKLFEKLKNDLVFPDCLGSEDDYYLRLGLTGEKHGGPLHYERPDQVLTQIFGKKSIRLFHPADSHCLYPRSYQSIKNNGSSSHYHFSQILNSETYDIEKFPLAKELIPHIGEIGPGDALFMPSGWWHEIKSLSPSMSVGYLRPCHIKHAPLHQTIRHIAWYEFNHERFDENIKNYIDTSGLDNLLDVANYLNAKKEYWCAILFGLGAFVEALKKEYQHNKELIKLIVSHENNDLCLETYAHEKMRFSEILPKCLSLRDKARNENNQFFKPKEVGVFLTEVEQQLA